MNQFLDFSKRLVMITGASSGIGRATAKVFAECGASLLLVDFDEKGLKETFFQLNQPEKHKLYRVHLDSKAEIDKLWQSLDDCPDTIINNAGTYPFQDFLKLSKGDYQNTLDINMNSMFWLCQNFIKERGNKGGVIVNIASIEAILPFKKDLIPYCMSKAGVIALTRSLARDYGRMGFRANVVLPGAIKTPGTASLIKEAMLKLSFVLMQTGIDFQHRLAMGRWGRAEEVAQVILFLASDMASYMQGAMVPVDGGFLSS
jgi:NAD(P)-dependent dehydrogenase (short-subunit alcohol dehydrogenase family)